MPKTLTADDLKLLVVFYGSDETFQREAKDRITDNDWNPVTEISEATVWQAITVVIGFDLGPVNKLVLLSEIKKLPGGEHLSGRPRVTELIEAIGEVNQTEANRSALVAKHAYGLDLLQIFLNERHVLRKMEMLPESASMEEYQRTFKSEIQRNTIVTSKATVPLDPDKPPMEGMFVPVPTGLNWFDNLLGGGPGEGDCVLFLAPSGGGKTVFSLQLADAKARTRQFVDVFLYEQEVKGDILERIYALATGKPRSEFRGKDFHQFSPDSQQKIQNSRKAYGKYLRLHEFSTGAEGNNGIADIRRVCENEFNDGEPPSMIIIDWVESAVRRAMATDKNLGDNMHHAISNFTEGFARLCREIKAQGVLLQQVCTAKAKRVGIEIHYSDAAECKSMANFMRYAVGVSARNDRGFARFHLSKATQSKVPQTVTVRLDGERNTFMPTDQDFDSTSFTFISRDSIAREPVLR